MNDRIMMKIEEKRGKPVTADVANFCYQIKNQSDFVRVASWLSSPQVKGVQSRTIIAEPNHIKLMKVYLTPILQRNKIKGSYRAA